MDHFEGSVRLPVTLPVGLHEWLRRTSFVERRSMAEIIREAVLVYREAHEVQASLPFDGTEGTKR